MNAPGRTGAAAAALALLLTGGCHPASGDLLRGGPSAPVPTPLPTNVIDPARVTPRPAAAAGCDHRASYRPRQPADGPAIRRIRDRGHLIVGTSLTAYGMSYMDLATGVMSGFEADLAREIARELLGEGTEKIRFVEVPAAARKDALAPGRETVDIVIRSVTMTCSRWAETAFSAEYLTSGQRVLVDRRTGIPDVRSKGIDALGGRKVCATQLSTSIEAIAAARSRPIPVTATNTADCMLLLQQGLVDAVSSDEVLLAGLAQQDRNTEMVGPPFTEEPLGIAMSLEAVDLVRLVNGVLERLRANGTWDLYYDSSLRPALGDGPARAPQPRYQD